jgi:hypothetical protein
LSDEILMIRPKPRWVMPLTTWRVMLKTLSRFVVNTAFHMSGSMFVSLASRVMPAQLTSMSTGPTDSSTRVIVSAQDSKQVTSPCTRVSS